MKLGYMALFAMLLGCKDTDNGEYYRSRDGHRYQITIASNKYSVIDVGLWLDLRVREWIASHPERQVRGLIRIAHNIEYHLIDDYRFPTEHSPTEWASGQYVYGAIIAAVWLSPTWDPAEGPGLAVIPHELDHAIGISHE